MNRRGPIVASSAFYLLTIALFIFHIEILLNRGFGRITRLEDFWVFAAGVICSFIAGAIGMGSQIWDRRLLPCGAKSRP